MGVWLVVSYSRSAALSDCFRFWVLMFFYLLYDICIRCCLQIAAMFKIGNSKELPVIPDHLSGDGKDFLGNVCNAIQSIILQLLSFWITVLWNLLHHWKDLFLALSLQIHLLWLQMERRLWYEILYSIMSVTLFMSWWNIREFG